MTVHSRLEVREAALEAILPMREEYRREMSCQIVHDSWHRRGLARSYVLSADGAIVGYGSVGGAPREAPDVVKEFFVQPLHRGRALDFFRALLEVSDARWVEAQTNDRLLLLMLLDCATDLTSETVLFADGAETAHVARDVTFRRLEEAEHDRVFPHTREPVGEWCLEREGDVVATGGFALHYNPPYADLYMEVAERERRRGLGRYLVQELKRACYDAGRIPAARCHQSNVASRATLISAGMMPCARIVRARLAGPASLHLAGTHDGEAT
jgi:GNAT superfamily N-acetyltransferase